MATVKVVTDPHKRGDTWIGILSIGPILINNLPPISSVVSCRIQYRSSSGVLGYELNSVPAIGKGIITIVNAVTWVFNIPKQFLPLETGNWDWDFETVDSTGAIDTYYRGTQTILADISHD